MSRDLTLRKYCDYSVEEGFNEDYTEWFITVPCTYPQPEPEGLGRCTGMYDNGDSITYTYEL